MKQQVIRDHNYNEIEYLEIDNNNIIIYKETYTYFKSGQLKSKQDNKGNKIVFYPNGNFKWRTDAGDGAIYKTLFNEKGETTNLIITPI